MLLMLILIGVSSCSNEDENIGNIPSQLYQDLVYGRRYLHYIQCGWNRSLHRNRRDFHRKTDA